MTLVRKWWRMRFLWNVQVIRENFWLSFVHKKSNVSSLDMLITYVSFSGRWVDVGGSLEEKTSKGGAKMKMDNESTICVELFLKISAFF